MMGAHFYDAPETLLTEKTKSGADPASANMHLKRIVLYSEPSNKASLNCATIKKVTGTEVINARGLWSSNTVTKMCASHFIMLNEFIRLDADQAIANRIIVIPFRSMFRTAENLEKLGTEHAFLVNSYYKTTEFIERAKYPLMTLLLRHYKIFKQEGAVLTNIPETIKKEGAVYMAESDIILVWFYDNYEFCDGNQKYIQIKDIWEQFKGSEVFRNLNKQGFTVNKKKVAAKLTAELSRFHRERYYSDNKDIRNVITNYRKKNIID